jgi:transcriptional regulator with XRE-family HTH domain
MRDNHNLSRVSSGSNRKAPRSGDDKSLTLRKTLSANIKKQRELAGLTQEKLAEKAGISANMINDIEGCRTWVSDKTLEKLTIALEVETYRFFIPLSLSDTEIDKAAILDLAKDLQKIRKDFNSSFDNALKSRGIKG